MCFLEIKHFTNHIPMFWKFQHTLTQTSYLSSYRGLTRLTKTSTLDPRVEFLKQTKNHKHR